MDEGLILVGFFFFGLAFLFVFVLVLILVWVLVLVFFLKYLTRGKNKMSFCGL